MRIFEKLILTGALFAALTVSANAADLAEGPMVEAAPTMEDYEMGSNWYLRGDIGYLTTGGDLSVDWTSTSNISDESFGKAWTAGGGVGYNFGFARADITVDIQGGTSVDGKRVAAPCGGALTGNCSYADDATLTTIPIMANLYFDLGTWAGITPYIGAGLGATRVSFDDFTTLATCNTTTGTCPADYALLSGTTYYQKYSNGGDNNWKFSYALMAGMSYALTDNFAVDVGYRYMVIEDGAAVTSFRRNGALPALGEMSYSDLNTQEVRLGLRYKLD